jgi:GTP pyrophosphokinase
LANGDTVEIITDSSRHPSRDWLKFVKTGKAQSRIKHWIRTEERARSIALAKEILEKEGRKLGVNVNKALASGKLDELARDSFSLSGVDDLLSAVGYAKITPRKVLNRLVPREEPAKSREPEKPDRAERDEGQDESQRSKEVSIKGVDEVLVRYAACCDPLPGEPIVGYITRGRGVTVHTANCPNVRNLEPERLLNISWEGGEEDRPHPAKISIKCRNTKGTLARIAAILNEQDVNIDSGSILSDEDGNSEMVFTLEVRDSGHLYNTIETISSLEEVLDVSRVSLT